MNTFIVEPDKLQNCCTTCWQISKKIQKIDTETLKMKHSTGKLEKIVISNYYYKSKILKENFKQYFINNLKYI